MLLPSVRMKAQLLAERDMEILNIKCLRFVLLQHKHDTARQSVWFFLISNIYSINICIEHFANK